MPCRTLNFKLKGVENTLSNATLTTIVNPTPRMPNRGWFAAGSDCHIFPPQFGNLISIMPLLAQTIIMALPKVLFNGKRMGVFPIWGV